MRKLLLSTIMVLLSGFFFTAMAAEKVVVFAAASTTNMLNEVLEMYNKKGGNAVGSYGASGTLAKQLQSGAPAGIFISANQEWMDKLVKEGLIKKDTVQKFLNNEIVLISNVKSNVKVDLSKSVDFAKILKNEKMVIGNPESVPAGNYAKQAFTKLGHWDKLSKNLVTASSVRDALAFVSRGEALLGVVFATDAAIDKNVKVVSKFPASASEEVSYPIGIVKENDSAEVKKLYDFLMSPEAKKVYKKYGFK